MPFIQVVDITAADVNKKCRIPYFSVVIKDGNCTKVTI